MDPNIWGPSGWIILHRLSFLFDNSEDAKKFYKTLEYILPCSTCRFNYKSHIEKIKFPKTKCDISNWIYKIHNRINKTLGKKKGQIYIKVKEHYNHTFTDIEIKNNEIKFLYAILYTFLKKNNKEYIANLNVFLEYWCKYSNIDYVLINNKNNYKKFLSKLC
jgi:hypothetical protein